MWRGWISGRKVVPKPVDIGGRWNVTSPSIMNSRKEGRAKNRTVENLIGGLTPDLRGHGVADVFGNPNPVPECLGRFRRKRGIIYLVIDRFEPGVLEKRANVCNAPSGKENGLTVVK